LRPRESWSDKAAYDATATRLTNMFRENFKAFADGVSAEVRAAEPVP
jgi:phosphoenolpyruvate carboxykinase (ATP)